MTTPDRLALLAFVEALCGTLGSSSAHRAAKLLDHIHGDLSMISPEGLIGPNSEDLEWATAGLNAIDENRVRFWAESIEKLSRNGVEVITSGMAHYPLNLRLVPNRPPRAVRPRTAPPIRRTSHCRGRHPTGQREGTCEGRGRCRPPREGRSNCRVRPRQRGAKLQAEDARRHGRRLLLLEHLVTSQPWAAALVGEPGVHVVTNVREIMDLVTLDLDTESFSLA